MNLNDRKFEKGNLREVPVQRSTYVEVIAYFIVKQIIIVLTRVLFNTITQKAGYYGNRQFFPRRIR